MDKTQKQLESLQSVINRAIKNVPFHQNRLKNLQIESIYDLSNLPFMTKKDFGEYYPYGLFAVPLRDIVRIHTAPGIGFNPTVSGYTKQDLSIWKSIVAKSLSYAGLCQHDILQISLDSGLANWGRDYKDGAEEIGASVIPNTWLSLEKQLMILRDYKTSFLITTYSSAFQLLEQMFKLNMNPTSLNLKTLILVGEFVEESKRVFLEEHLHVTTWFHYGLSEIPGPAIGFECRNKDGFYINDEHFLAEIIDLNTHKALTNGQIGELVLTTLTTRAFPLIRFRTGDLACFLEENKKCSCKLELSKIKLFPDISPEISENISKIDNFLNIGGVKVYLEQVLLHLEKLLGFKPINCKLIQDFENGKHILNVYIPIDNNLFSDEIKILEQLINNVSSKLTENLGVYVKLKLKELKS